MSSKIQNSYFKIDHLRGRHVSATTTTLHRKRLRRRQFDSGYISGQTRSRPERVWRTRRAVQHFEDRRFPEEEELHLLGSGSDGDDQQQEKLD